MPSKHGSPKKRNKKFKGLKPSIRINPVGLPIVPETLERQRTESYAMAEKMRVGLGFFGAIRVLGIRLNIAKRLLETLFTDEACMVRVCAGLAALIAVNKRLDDSGDTLVTGSDAEVDDIKRALNVADAIEDTVTRPEFAEAARYVANVEATGNNLVGR